MPTRLVREGINDSERVDALSLQAELCFRRLINVVDDYGRFEADPVLIISRAFPRRATKIKAADVESWLLECAASPQPLMRLYRIGRKRYLQIENFNQRVRTESKCPGPPLDSEPGQVAAMTDGQMAVIGPHTAAHARASSATPPSITPTDDPSVLGDSDPEQDSEPRGIETSPLFEAFWRHWSSVRGTNHRLQAIDAWSQVVTIDNEDEVLACCASYLDSLENPAKGYNPENFLSDQAADGFSARWPPRNRDPGEQRRQRDVEKFRLMLASTSDEFTSRGKS